MCQLNRQAGKPTRMVAESREDTLLKDVQKIFEQWQCHFAQNFINSKNTQLKGELPY